MKNQQVTNLETKTLSELAAQYNDLAKTLGYNPVKKFKDKPTAIRRVTEALEAWKALPHLTVTLTDAEFVALKTCLNYGTREEQLSDNFSNGGQEDFKKALGWNDKQVSALIGSLESKGLGVFDGEKGTTPVFWLSELGVNTVFDEIEAGRTVVNGVTPKKDRKKRMMRFIFVPSGPARGVRDTSTLRGQCVELLSGEGATFPEVEALVAQFDKAANKEPKNLTRRAYELVRIMHYYLGYGIKHDMETGKIRIYEKGE